MKSHSLRLALIIGVAVIILSLLAMAGYYRKTLVKTDNNQATTTPAMASGQTVSLAGGGITFEVPKNMATHQALQPTTAANPSFDKISLNSSVDSNGNNNSLGVGVNRGWYEASQEQLPFHTPGSKKYKYSIQADNSVFPSDNPLISSNNTKVYSIAFSTNNTPGVFQYWVEIHTNSHYTDGKIHQTIINVNCSNGSPTNTCHDIVRQILSSLQIHEPLSADISAI